MKINKVTIIAVATLFFAACHATKKNTNTATTSNTPTTTAAAGKPANGIYAPGDEELVAIQDQYKDVTLAQLKEGHSIYTEGACIKCHGAKNIYKRDAAEWKGIIDEMARKAQISEEQKDAVYKYVLAIKATQSKNSK